MKAQCYNVHMQLALLIPEYLVWHYSKAIRLILNIASNFIWFVYHFFSVPLLSNTIFSPLHGVGSDFEFVSRFLGLVIKTASLFSAYLIMAMMVFVGAIAVVVWVLLPLIVVSLTYNGFRLLFI